MKTKFLNFDTAGQVQGWNLKLISYLSLIAATTFVLNTIAAEPTGLGTGLMTTSLTTSMGTTLDPKDPQTSIGLEPELTFHLAEKTNLAMYGWIDRPTDSYKNFSVPLLTLAATQKFDLIPGFNTSASLVIAALDMDSWKAEGHRLRIRPAFRLAKEILTGLTLSGRIGPYVYLNRYSQSNLGTDFARYGFNERLGLDYVLGGLAIQLALVFDQRNTRVWKNDYSTLEQIQYNFSDAFGVGVNHSLLGGFVDESTGAYKKIQFFDSRQSRVSAFIEVKF